MSEKSPLVENFSIDALIDELDQEHKISMLEDALEEGENSGESTRSFEDIVKEAIATSRPKGKP